MKPKSKRFIPRRPRVTMAIVSAEEEGAHRHDTLPSMPDPPGPVTVRDAHPPIGVVPASTPAPDRPWAKPSLPNMKRLTELPTDREMQAAQSILDEAEELIRLRDALLTIPDWIPVGEAVQVLGREIRRLRSLAANTLRCDPILFDDDGE